MPVSVLIGIVFFISPPHQLYWFFCNLVENMSIQEIGQKNEHMFKCQRTYVRDHLNICPYFFPNFNQNAEVPL